MREALLIPLIPLDVLWYVSCSLADLRIVIVDIAVPVLIFGTIRV